MDDTTGGEMETMSQAMNRLADEGYTVEWRAVGDGRLECSEDNQTVDPAEIGIDQVLRFEGESNPDDEAVLFALTGPRGHKGLYAAPYGAAVPAADVAVMVALGRRH